MNRTKPAQDVFAQIAALSETQRRAGLVACEPPSLPARELPNDPGQAVIFRRGVKLTSPRQLRRELEKQRRYHAKFLRNFAPPVESLRQKCPLRTFQWRLESEEDLRDFHHTNEGHGAWKRVRIPHYGPPLGRAVAWYRRCVTVTRSMLRKGTLFVRFKGVDYKAHVFLNGHYLGSHEGFFAPFEFELTDHVRRGRNVLLIKVENDAVHMGNNWGEGEPFKEQGDKIYAATGPGYDEPQVGWHRCPAGMGIYQDVSIEARNAIHIRDVFVRPLVEQRKAEAWVEIQNCHNAKKTVNLSLSVFGQNFRATVCRNLPAEPPGLLGPGINYMRVPIDMSGCRLWEPKTPWLYQMQVALHGEDDRPLDCFARQFGMRSFQMGTADPQKGRLYLNGREIRLRGANTMGFEQQDVMKGNWQQLIDDILLAKICHMNFWRLTQRPVQEEVYDFCDRLGLMTQTDLPLFGVLRRNQFAEAIRQAGEMEHFVRSHCCNVMISYINEPFPNARNMPHRALLRNELEGFFRAADEAVHLHNPERVIKAVDGDYDPPAPGLPDSHCYAGWYNGHAIDLGRLHKGYWLDTKPEWMHACGEYGAEGLDSVQLMRRRYPSAWLPRSAAEEAAWTPNRIPMAQTGKFHYLFFDTPRTLDGWVASSQRHQARMTRLMTEAFRRDNRMNSIAIHLFIDAWPSGWMKAIMDCEREPKPAYFAYREALTPLMANIRTDRLAYFAGEPMCFEFWTCNDMSTVPEDTQLRYRFDIGGKEFLAQKAPARVAACQSTFQGFLRVAAPDVATRTTAVLRLGLTLPSGRVLHDTALEVEIFPTLPARETERVVVIGGPKGKAARLARDLGLGKAASGDLFLVDDMSCYADRREEIESAVHGGAIAVLLELPTGVYQIGGNKVVISPCSMNPVHFVSRDTGHPLVRGFQPEDFSLWYDPSLDRISPLLWTTFSAADGWLPILTSGHGGFRSDWEPAFAAAEKQYGHGVFRICQVALAGRTINPVATLFARRVIEYEKAPLMHARGTQSRRGQPL